MNDKRRKYHDSNSMKDIRKKTYLNNNKKNLKNNNYKINRIIVIRRRWITINRRCRQITIIRIVRRRTIGSRRMIFIVIMITRRTPTIMLIIMKRNVFRIIRIRVRKTVSIIMEILIVRILL